MPNLQVTAHRETDKMCSTAEVCIILTNQWVGVKGAGPGLIANTTCNNKKPEVGN